MGPFATVPRPQLVPGNIKTMGTALAVDSCPLPPRTEQRSRPLPPTWGCLFLFSVFLSEITPPTVIFSKNGIGSLFPTVHEGLQCQALDWTNALLPPWAFIYPSVQTKGWRDVLWGPSGLLTSRILCPGASHSANSHDDVPSGNAVLQKACS